MEANSSRQIPGALTSQWRSPRPLSALSTRSPVAARHHLLAVNDDKLLQGLPREAAACLAAVCVPTRAPHTQILGQEGKEVGWCPRENGAQAMSKSHAVSNLKQLRELNRPLPSTSNAY